jgi:4-hydroxybenzoate polyprenyltransferase
MPFQNIHTLKNIAAMNHDVLKKILGFAALTKSYFSLLTSTAMASITIMLVANPQPLQFINMVLFFFLSTAFLNSYNNLADIKSDILTKENFPLTEGVIKPRQAALFSASVLLMAIIALIPLVVQNLHLFFVLLFDLLLGYIYSFPKIRLKRYPVIKGSVLITHTVLLPLVAGSILIGKDVFTYGSIMVPLYLMGLAIHTVQDIGDVHGDLAIGDRTLPLILGLKKSVWLVLALLSAAALSSWVLVSTKNLAMIMSLFIVQGLLFSILLNKPNLWKRVYWSTALISLIVLVLLLVK